MHKIFFSFRIDPKIKEAAKKAAIAAKMTISRYVEELIKLDLWRKRILEPKVEQNPSAPKIL
jgi:hypothetical protein